MIVSVFVCVIYGNAKDSFSNSDVCESASCELWACDCGFSVIVPSTEGSLRAEIMQVPSKEPSEKTKNKSHSHYT